MFVVRLLFLLAGALILAAAALALLRPSPLLGIDDRALAYSVGRGAGSVDSTCRQRPNGTWRCQVRFGSDGVASYRVTTHGLGCWQASGIETSEGPGLERMGIKGCINIRDHLRLLGSALND